MNAAWPLVRLGELLTKSEDWIALQPDARYREVTVRLWGKGVVLRGEVSGAEIAAKSRLRVHTDQFIFSRIDARNGAIGIVPASLDGAVVSSDFPVFSIDRHRLLPAFLGWMSKTEPFVGRCRAASEGTTNRIRLKEDRFLNVEIPLPPLAEQRRIVAKVEALAAKTQEAHGLHQSACAELDMLLASAADVAFRPKKGWTLKTVKKFCEQPQYGYTASASPDAVGPKMLRITDIQDSRVNWESVPYCDCPDPGPYLLQPNDIVFARTGATTGKSYIIRECPQAVFASYLIRLRVKEGVEPDYLYRYFQTPAYWTAIRDESRGTGQANCNGKKLANLVVPLAPREEQRRIVAYLDGLQAKVDALKALQAQTAAELDALLPAVLDRAFKGKL